MARECNRCTQTADDANANEDASPEGSTGDARATNDFYRISITYMSVRTGR